LTVDSVLLTDLKPWPFQIWSLLMFENKFNCLLLREYQGEFQE
jgi:hypothetical protein